ncbi:glutathione S-transferase [Erythrobacter sp.]|uniref:glutathione S-transferase n=1 Tax=Erythrobacter sp. TaxID=1042 RepID=UPI001B1571A6|nr:glutathione S-transferase [Erythrobacter sp.]MBO6525805.1 glutathione S-transferase [Erythrobacter sp.]MBO6529520.1 glutathione S-transferase [Erythrobacter sp.]
MADPVLYSFRRCPYAMRARMALSVSGAQYEHREVVLRDKPPQMLEASPKGTVPVLVAENGEVLEESLDVMRWALGQSDPEGWLDRDDPALIEANDGPFKHHLDRYKYATRYDDVDPEEHRAAALDILRTLEERLEASAYLCGEQRGFADIAIFPFIRQFANADRAWFDVQDLSKLQAWLEGLITSDLFTGVMQKHPQWKAA